jgi:pentatricopeptide repeat protein
LLLYSAVEAGQLHRCKAFFDKLCTLTMPSGHDFVNMIRCMARRGDPVTVVEAHMKELMGLAFKIDALSRNRALAACASSGALGLAEVLVASEICREAMDTVAYNTLMKGYGLAGNCPRCFELYDKLRANGLAPSEMTFGILLDACNTAGEYGHARRVFKDLLDSGLRPNVVHYTTLMKGLVNAGHLDDAAGVLRCMLQSPDTAPDVVTYSMLVQAHADRGTVGEAVQVLKQMLHHGIKPDDIILNIVLSGCCVRPLEHAQVFRIFRWLLQHGLQPSTATLSILLKALVKSEAWAEALEFLREVPERLSVWPEPRLYTQLAWACAQAGHGHEAVEAYAIMVDAARRHGSDLCKVYHLRMIRICASCDKGARAQAICRGATGMELPLTSEETPGQSKFSMPNDV